MTQETNQKEIWKLKGRMDTKVRLKRRKPTKQWVLAHLKESECPYSEADKITSAIMHNGKFPCPCSTFDCCYKEWWKDELGKT